MDKRNISKIMMWETVYVCGIVLAAGLIAGIHLGFAFPFISKMLKLFAFDDTFLNIAVNLGCFAVFGVFYAFIYKITSSVYYTIVSGGRE